MGVRDPKANWFLTYPQCNDSPTDLLDKLQALDHGIIHYVIAREKHRDGNNHLHAYIKLSEGVVLRDAPQVFNLLDKTGNYQPCRSPKSVIKYCTKESEYISNFDVSKYLQKKGKLDVSTIKSKSAKQALLDGDIGLCNTCYPQLQLSAFSSY